MAHKQNIQSHPLTWPEGWERAKSRAYGKFKFSFERARRDLFRQIELMGGKEMILSTNIPLRKTDNQPYSGVMRIDDPGVAVYFKYKDKDMVFACDKFQHVQDNVRAIGLTVEALRGIERWGASDMMERAFSGFLALPEMGKTEQNWRSTLEIPPDITHVTIDTIESQFKTLAKIYHPDTGSTPDTHRWGAIIEARSAARREIGA